MSAERTGECCTSAPRIVIEGYERIGSVKETSAGLKYYEATVSEAEITRPDLAVIMIHDISGPGIPQTDQQADRISKGLGCKVVSPFWFGFEGGYPGTLGTPEKLEAMWKWIGERAGPEKVIERTDDIISTLKGEGITKFALVGFCWGGIQTRALATRHDLFIAAASIHGKAYTAEQGARIATPFYNLPSRDEGLQPEFQEALPAGIKEKSNFKLFDDVPHGFAAARGQWTTNETHRKRAEEVIEDFVDFVKELADA